MRDAASVSAAEAVAMDPPVVDLVATDVDDLFAQIDSGQRADGQPYEFDGEPLPPLSGLPVQDVNMSLGQSFLHVLSDPNIAFILFTIGFYGIVSELFHPNFFSGPVGVIALVLAFIGSNSLPLNVAGLLLILLGIGLFILELHVTSYGLLTIGGVIAIVLGAFALWTGVDPQQDAINVSISPWLLALVVALSLAYVYGIVRALMAMRNRPVLARPVMGLVGAGGVAQTLIAPTRHRLRGRRGVVGAQRRTGNCTGQRRASRRSRWIGADRGTRRRGQGEHGRGRDARMTGTAEELIHHHGTPLAIAGQAVRSGPSAVAVVGDGQAGLVRWFLDGVTQRLEERGYPVHRPNGRDAMHLDPEVRVILNAVSADDPTSFRRRSKDIFVVGLAELEQRPDDMLQAGYSLLVRSLSNVFIPMVRDRRWHRCALHHHGAGLPPLRARRRRRRLLRVRGRAPDPAGRVATGDREQLRAGPAAGAVAGRRPHRVDPSGRDADGGAGPAAGAVAHRRAAHRRTSCGTSSACSGSAASRTGTPARGMTAIGSG